MWYVDGTACDVPWFVDQSIGANQQGDQDVLNNLTETTDFPVLKLVFPDQLDIPRPTVEPDLAWVVKKQKMDMHSQPADHPDSPASVLIFTPCIHLSIIFVCLLVDSQHTTFVLGWLALDRGYIKSHSASLDDPFNPSQFQKCHCLLGSYSKPSQHTTFVLGWLALDRGYIKSHSASLDDPFNPSQFQKCHCLLGSYSKPSKHLFSVGLVRHIKQRIEIASLLDRCVTSGNKLASGISAAFRICCATLRSTISSFVGLVRHIKQQSILTSRFLVWLAPSKHLFPVGLVRHIKQRIEIASLLDRCVTSGNKLASGISAAFRICCATLRSTISSFVGLVCNIKQQSKFGSIKRLFAPLVSPFNPPVLPFGEFICP
ncbi:hypothetical protein F2Q69_00022559 [Brassica cretica]|uniref:Uncharacterized protein n=1 Tax=Brassica cretica TaxID=69181 RepID=A0A8S9Q4S4_BRACR|nr:hypothetical protein F2Q69_00022559 [Brassica cretica]